MEILRNRYGGYICVILLFMSCWTLPVAAAESDDYQPQETIRVGFFAFNDYHMMDADGHRSGYGYDVLQYMGRYTNWHYEYVGYDKSWEQMQSMLENGEIDMLTLAQPTPEGRLQFDFSSKSIGTSSALLTVRAGDERRNGEPVIRFTLIITDSKIGRPLKQRLLRGLTAEGSHLQLDAGSHGVELTDRRLHFIAENSLGQNDIELTTQLRTVLADILHFFIGFDRIPHIRHYIFTRLSQDHSSSDLLE